MQERSSRGLMLGSLFLLAVGMILLLNNFLFISGFNVTTLWPLLLVVLGGIIVLRGDILSGGSGRTFGVTRGSVETAVLEINSGAVDVKIRPLSQPGRLIAGQFAPNTRPQLAVSENHAHIQMDRASAPLLALSDWEIGVAHDLPWSIYVSTHLGEVDFDLNGLILQNSLIATGIGDIRVICPTEAMEPLTIRSTLGRIQFITPQGIPARIRVKEGRFFSVKADTERYEQVEDGVYMSRNFNSELPVVDVYITGSFGDAYIA